MALRFPSATSGRVASFADTGTSGVSNNTFTIPTDSQGVTVKVWTGTTFSGTSPTCDVYLQTTEDGGTTWRDLAHFPQITGAISNQNAFFVTIGAGMAAAASIATMAASNLGVGKVSGQAFMSNFARLSIQYGGTIGTNTSINCDVFSIGEDIR